MDTPLNALQHFLFALRPFLAAWTPRFSNFSRPVAAPAFRPWIPRWRANGRGLGDRRSKGTGRSGHPARTSATNPIGKRMPVNRNFAACHPEPLAGNPLRDLAGGLIAPGNLEDL